jgi:hypothetical protein
MKQRTLFFKRVFETSQATKEKVGEIKDHDASTLGASDEKPHKDDEVGKDEAQYDAAKKEYDFNACCNPSLGLATKAKGLARL